jgi:hypothetical protein
MKSGISKKQRLASLASLASATSVVALTFFPALALVDNRVAFDGIDLFEFGEGIEFNALGEGRSLYIAKACLRTSRDVALN